MKKEKEYIPPLVKVTKISDDKFKGKHPNNIEKGYIAEGLLQWPLNVGKSVVVIKHDLKGIPDLHTGYFNTSAITKIINKNRFNTLNSTYEIKYL